MRKFILFSVFIGCIGLPVCLGKTVETSTVPATTKAVDKIVVLRLDGKITEAPPSVDLGISELQLNLFWDLLRMIRMAKNDPEVGALVVLIDEPELSLAQLSAMGMELGEFRASGKKVFVSYDSLLRRCTFALPRIDRH